MKAMQTLDPTLRASLVYRIHDASTYRLFNEIASFVHWQTFKEKFYRPNWGRKIRTPATKRILLSVTSNQTLYGLKTIWDGLGSPDTLHCVVNLYSCLPKHWLDFWSTQYLLCYLLLLIWNHLRFNLTILCIGNILHSACNDSLAVQPTLSSHTDDHTIHDH